MRIPRNFIFIKFLIAASIALALANCGGGGGDSSTASGTSGISTATDGTSGSLPGTGGSAPGGGTPQIANAISLENAKPGTASWKLVSPALNHEIEGYASLTSVNRGASIDFFVNTTASSFNIDVYRMGYYGGNGARLMQSFTNVRSRPQPMPCLNPNQVIECNWFVSQTLTIPNATQDPTSLSYWTSGVYLAKLTTNGQSRKDSYIIFVVRDDARTATYVSELPITTYQAYNFWGGKSLYTGCMNHDANWVCKDGTPPATEISFNRPFLPSTNAAAAYGAGAGEFITNEQNSAEGAPINPAGFDYNMVRWMEKQGYDVKYITNLDLHENPSVLSKAKAFLSIGHDEYYSKPMWDNLMNARSAGINLGFFSANQIYWQVRFSDSLSGSMRKNRNMICYRSGSGDPVTDNNLTTNQFRYLGRPEGALIGNQYGTAPVMDNITVTNAAHWLFAGSGAANGTVLKGLLGYEINAVVPGVTPQQTKVLAHSVSGQNTSDMTYYVDASSAQVFATGTIQWSWGLDNFVSNNVRPDYTSPIAQAITANVFDALAERNLSTFTNAASQLDMSTPAGNLDAAQIVQNPKPADSTKTNQWRLAASDEQGYYRIVSRANGLCLDSSAAQEGASAGTHDCNAGDAQKWRLNPVSGDTYTLTEKRSGRCLEVPGGSTANGTGLTIATCRANSRQQWQRKAVN